MPQDHAAPSQPEGAVLASALVAYQPGTVVSRTLVRKTSGTVTVFAFDAGEGLSEHTAPFDALALSLEGEADISSAGTAHHLKTGQLLNLPAGQPHAVKAITSFKMLLIMIKT